MFWDKKVKNVINILRERLFLGWGEERESFEKIVFMEMEIEVFILSWGRIGVITGSSVGARYM